MVRAGGNVDAFPGSLILPFAGFLYTNSHSFHLSTFAPVARMLAQLMNHSPSDLTWPVVSRPVSVFTHTRVNVAGSFTSTGTQAISSPRQHRKTLRYYRQ